MSKTMEFLDFEEIFRGAERPIQCMYVSLIEYYMIN